MLFSRYLNPSKKGCSAARSVFAAAGLLAAPMSFSVSAQLIPVDSLGLAIQPGFRVSIYADAALAPSPQAVTVDASGNVVVAGPQEVRTLLDDDGDGFPDRFVVYARVPGGAMGMAVHGAQMVLADAKGILGFQDLNYDGVADGLPQRIWDHPPGRYGMHGLRLGPDGSWYGVGGLGSGFSQAIIPRGAPSVAVPTGGVWVRWPGDREAFDILGHGFRNPYDFDFNSYGDVLMGDADAEALFLRPGYLPARLFHAQPGGHHGWQGTEPAEAFGRMPYQAGSAAALLNLGRGAPSGVVCYRHYQFPERYRNGFFQADWVQGQVRFVSLTEAGSTYAAEAEVFLDDLGRRALTPTDLEVLPDGSLLVAMGGWRIPGGLYRIQYVEEPAYMFNATNWMYFAESELALVLDSPQPMAAWSRASWEEAARRVGPELFAQAILNENEPVYRRLRAVEVLTEGFGGLGAGLAESAIRSGSAELRARVAWSMGREPCGPCYSLLLLLARDESPYVRTSALTALRERAEMLDMTALQQALGANLDHPDPRVRAAALQLGMHLTPVAWEALWNLLQKAGDGLQLTAVTMRLMRHRDRSVQLEAVEKALSVLARTRSPALQLTGVMLIQSGLGGQESGAGASNDLLAHYRAALPLGEREELIERIGGRVEPLMTSSYEPLRLEAARLLGMIAHKSPELASRLLDLIQIRSSVSSDLHYLAVLSQLPAAALTDESGRIAAALISLEIKAKGAGQSPGLSWSEWQQALVKVFVGKNPKLTLDLLEHPQFALPGHESWVPFLGADYYAAAAGKFFEAVQAKRDYQWSVPLVELLSSLPPSQVLPVFRRQWSNPSWREAMIPAFARAPAAGDRDKFLWGLGSSDADVLGASLSALWKLPVDPAGETAEEALRLLRRLLRMPEARGLRQQTVTLLRRELKFPMEDFAEQEGGLAFLQRAYEPLFDWVMRTRPQLYQSLDAIDGGDAGYWESRYEAMLLKQGNPERGRILFQGRQCLSCHAGTSHLGPDLAGVSSRLTRRAMFDAVVFPNRDVSERYRSMVVTTRDQLTFTGVPAHEAWDGMILQPSPDSAVRLFRGEMDAGHRSRRSFMPSGLLKGLDPQALADLFSFISTMPPMDP